MPARIRAAVGEAGGFNAVQKLFTARQSRQAVKASPRATRVKASRGGHVLCRVILDGRVSVDAGRTHRLRSDDARMGPPVSR